MRLTGQFIVQHFRIHVDEWLPLHRRATGRGIGRRCGRSRRGGGRRLSGESACCFTALGGRKRRLGVPRECRRLADSP